MAVHLTEIHQEDISYILENPWHISSLEWSLDDEYVKKNMLLIILDKLKRADADGYSKIWKTSSCEPIAILGGYRTDEKKYETFFVASKHMKQYTMELSFDMRKILKEKAPYYKGYSCGLYSASSHPALISWFRFIGFDYVPERNIGNTRYFEYVSPGQ